MQFLKRFSRGVFGLVFRLGLAGLILITPLVLVFGTSDQLKKSLAESKIYDKAIAAVIENAVKDSANQTDSPFNQPAVQDAAKQALSPSFVQNTSEGILDGIYGWLQQKTPEPSFNIDVSAAKQQFVAAVGDYAVERAKQLPACTPQQARQLGADVDPLNVQCIPAGYDIEGLRAQVAAEIDKQPEQEGNLLQQSTISPETLPKDENGQTPVQNITQHLEKAPEIYSWLTRSPWLLGILTIITGGLYLFLSEDKRKAGRSMAITVLVFGVLTLVGILISNYAFAELQRSDLLLNADDGLKQPITDFVQSIQSALNQRLVIFGGIYTLLGGGTLAGLYFTKPKVPTMGEKTDEPEKSTEKEEPKRTEKT